ncbi:hypothetical protein MTO96_009107 [Rhipicephalus appendiculatus]
MNSMVVAAVVLCGLMATVHCGGFGGGHSVIVVKGIQTGGGGGAGFGHGSAASATTAGSSQPQVVQGPTYVVKTLHQVKKISHGGSCRRRWFDRRLFWRIRWRLRTWRWILPRLRWRLLWQLRQHRKGLWRSWSRRVVVISSQPCHVEANAKSSSTQQHHSDSDRLELCIMRTM